MASPYPSFSSRPSPILNLAPSTRIDEYDGSSSDSCDTTRLGTRSRRPTLAPNAHAMHVPVTPYLSHHSGRSSLVSSVANTPIPSRSTSPLPGFFSTSSSCTSSASEDEDEPMHLMLANRHRLHREHRSRWWHLPTMTTRRRNRGRSIIRLVKRWSRRLFRHPLFPRQPITIILTLILLSIFAISITFLIMHILNPDKEPLPWRAYCSQPSTTYFTGDLPSSVEHTSQVSISLPRVTRPPFPPNNLEELPPAGLFIGVFSVDSAFERRMLIRSSWASHARSRAGAGDGDGGIGTSRTIVRFILGQPRKAWDRRIQLEMQMYNDIIILPVAENMNSGKTHTFFSWAYLNAWVPPVYTKSRVNAPNFSYSGHTAMPPPTLAPHDPQQAWEDQSSLDPQFWVRPDFVVKADDDAFVMLAELESRLRIELHTQLDKRGYPIDGDGFAQSAAVLNDTGRSHPNITADPLVYWGYLVKNRFNTFMAGELYSLSWSLTEWVARSPEVKTMTKGAEDKQTAKWMKIHPQASRIRWVSERCWMYDHPRSGTVYGHGFLFPSEATRIKRATLAYQDKQPQEITGNVVPSGTTQTPTPSLWAYSSVSTWGVRYSPPLPDMKLSHSVEALVEGSEMSTIREGSAMTPEYAWVHREGRIKQYEGKRVGGTIVVHFIKKNLWFLETALALLEGEDYSESEKIPLRRDPSLSLRGASTRTLRLPSSHMNRTSSTPI